MRALQLIEDRRIEMTEISEPAAPAFSEVTVSIKASPSTTWMSGAPHWEIRRSGPINVGHPTGSTT